MNKIVLVLFLALLTKSYTRPQDDFYKNELLVKIKPEARELAFMNSGTMLEDIYSALGEYSSTNYINKKLLQFIDNKFRMNKTMIFTSEYHPLHRIFKINYKNNINPQLAARKISTLPYVEYAEVSPIHYILSTPNDSLFNSQYYIPLIEADKAWDLIDTTNKILVGVVDTGIDYNHTDLNLNIFSNSGEIGLDKNGIDKRFNGIDDDSNGYIDDWHGWDFGSSDSSGQDNNPLPGHIHGTHVAGTIGAITNNRIGIAGTAKSVQLLPVKIGYDNPLSTAVKNSYEGILYAAAMGAGVINCSWGSSNKAQSEQDIISTASNLGAIVVAAAGNNGENIAFYPAAYNGAISVAATNESDRLTSFSNFHGSVDVCSPGQGIMATIPNDEYVTLDGTSMATPIVSSVVAMTKLSHPNLNHDEIIEFVKATSDNVDSLNPQDFTGKMGRGRVNAFKAVSMEKAASVVISSYTITDENNDRIFDAGEKINIKITLKNILDDVKSVKLEAFEISGYSVDYENKSISFGDFKRAEEKASEQNISFRIPKEIPINFPMDFKLIISDENGFINREIIRIIMRPAYRTMNSNNIAVTFNNTGNIGFNDYPVNDQGDGFRYKNGYNMLYEGSLMVACGPDKISDKARGIDQNLQNEAFSSYDIFNIKKPGKIAAEEGIANFFDTPSETNIGISVNQKVYQFNDSNSRDFVIIQYNISNNSGTILDSLYTGLFFDWDIGPSGSYNKVKFNFENGFAYVQNMKYDTLPLAGAVLLSEQKLNFFAIDNDGNSLDNPGIYNGFSNSLKWRMMSSGIDRKESNITDVSFVISAGPIKLNVKDTAKVTFALLAGKDINQINEAAKSSLLYAQRYSIAKGNFFNLPKQDSLWLPYPNPIERGTLTVKYSIFDTEYISMSLFDINGGLISKVIEHQLHTPDYYTRKIEIDNLPIGKYFLVMNNSKTNFTVPVIIVR